MRTSSRHLFAGLALLGLLFATALPSSAQETIPEDPPPTDQQLLVTYLIYSGQPNPTLLVTDPRQVADLQRRIADARATGTPTGDEGPEPVLGYNGVMIEDPATTYDESSTFYVIKNDIVRVDGGNPDDPYARSTTVSGDAVAIEDLLISLGVQARVINEAAMAEIREPDPKR
jgi:hypothetical protein